MRNALGPNSSAPDLLRRVSAGMGFGSAVFLGGLGVLEYSDLGFWCFRMFRGSLCRFFPTA